MPNCFEIYSAWSGQVANVAKSGSSAVKGVSETVRRFLANPLQVCKKINQNAVQIIKINKRGLLFGGKGVNIHVWNDPWVNFTPKVKDEQARAQPLVADNLITNSWDEERLGQFFDPESTEAVLRIPAPVAPGPDKLPQLTKWVFFNNATYVEHIEN